VSAPGYFIAIEGGDGAGKSTQMARLAAWLREVTGREVVATREPGGTELGQTLRNAVMHGEHVDPRTEALLYATDRAHHVASVVRPALERGAIVISDRYLDSSIAYQGHGRELGAEEVERLSLWATDGLLPDLTVLLDLAPDAARARMTGELDRIEQADPEFFERTRDAYLERVDLDPGRYVVVSADADIASIQMETRGHVARALELDPDLIARGDADGEADGDADGDASGEAHGAPHGAPHGEAEP